LLIPNLNYQRPMMEITIQLPTMSRLKRVKVGKGSGFKPHSPSSPNTHQQKNSKSSGSSSFICCLSHSSSVHKTCRNPTLAKCRGESQHSQSWGLGVLRDSRMFRVRQQGPKHLALRCSWFHWKVLEA
jgi:hypothetical protein